MRIFKQTYRRDFQEIIGMATLEDDGTIQYELFSSQEILPHYHFEVTEKLKQEATLYFSRETE